MTTVNSTPMSLRISSNKHVVHERKYMDPQLKSDLEGNHTQIAPAAFLEAMVPQHSGKGWDEFLEAVKNDETISGEMATSSLAQLEPQLYEPFAIIANRITDLFKEHCGSSVERKIKFFSLGSSYITGPPSYDNGEPVKGTESQRKPDGLALMAEDLKEGDCFKQHEEKKEKRARHVAGRDLSDGWRRSILAVEHKLTSKEDKKLSATSQPRGDVNPRASFSTTASSSIFTSSGNATSSSNVASHKLMSDPRRRDNMQTPSKAKPRRGRASSSHSRPKHHHQTRSSTKSSSALVQAVTSKGFVPPSHASSGSNKRTRRDSDDDSDEDEDDKPQQSRPDKKRRREAQIKQGVSDPAPIELTGDELQLASYAMEMMCVLGNRAHAFGILIDRFETTFWYYDRSGAVSSESFDFRYNLEFLARFIVAFSCMSTTQLGFISELQPPEGVPLGSIAALAPASLADFTMDCGDVTVTLVKPLEVRYGFVGRGTVVYEVKMCKNADSAESEAGDIKEEVAVIKLSWQVTTRRPEWEWIEEALREGVPQELIIQVFGHRVLQQLSAGFRSQLLSSASTGAKWENRELRIQTMEKLSPIADLSGIELMFAIWCYLLTIEFLDYANIRHRDISPGNLGWIRDEEGRLYPKLMDFDLAAHVLREEDELAASKHWTGTLPYMAVDLLRHPGCSHPLRFDAESIIWCATWLSCCAKKNYAEKNHPFLAWFDPLSSLVAIASRKITDMGFTLESIPTLSRNKVMERGLLGVMWLYGMVYHKSTYWALNERAQGRIPTGPVEVMEEVAPDALRTKLNEGNTPWAVRSAWTEWVFNLLPQLLKLKKLASQRVAAKLCVDNVHLRVV
ncbi:hypothetical protein FRB96_004477 [Tulasnella sp. 330]|nr:hypothetical protein FRB96_004477 [Tulasnella sp. 330]